MSKILSMFGFKKNDDDNIPEMILHKNDPEPYYDKDLKVWMIPGQEEEIKKMLQEQKKPPPVKSQKKVITEKKSNDQVDNSLVNPRKPAPLGKKPAAKTTANRYASVLSNNYLDESNKNKKELNENAVNISEKIDQEDHEQNKESNDYILSKNIGNENQIQNKNNNQKYEHVGDNNEIIKQNVKEQIKIEEEHSNVGEQIIENKGNGNRDHQEFNNELYISNRNAENMLFNSLNHTLNKNHRTNNNMDANQLSISSNSLKNLDIEALIEEKKKDLEQEIRKSLENEYNITQKELKEKYENEIVQINHNFQMKEALLNSDILTLKENLNKFIEENIINKLKIDDLNQDIIIKDKQLENYKNIVDLYQKNQQEQIEEIASSVNMSVSNIERENNVNEKGNKFYCPYDLEGFKEIENENLKLVECTFDLKKEIANLSLEKSFTEFRFREQERNMNILIENLIEKNKQQDKIIDDANKQIKNLIKINNTNEKQLFNMDEITKLNENLKVNILNLENQINVLKKTNENNSNMIKNLKEEIEKKNQQIKTIEDEMLEKMNYSSKKIFENEKEIKNYKAIKEELEAKVDDFQLNLLNYKKQEIELQKLHEKLFEFEFSLKNKKEEIERVIVFFRDTLLKYLESGIARKEHSKQMLEILDTLNEKYKCNDVPFDQLICNIFKSLFNHVHDTEIFNNMLEKDHNILLNECGSTKRTLGLTDKINLNLKREIETLNNEKDNLLNKIKDIISKQNIQDIMLSEKEEKLKLYEESLHKLETEKELAINNLVKEIQISKNQIKETNTALESLKVSEFEHKKLNSENLRAFNEEKFKLNFEVEKLHNVNKSFSSVFNIIIEDLNQFIKNLPDNEFYKDMQKFSIDIDSREHSIENKVVYKIKILKNLIENISSNNSLVNQEMSILKDDLSRNINFATIKEKENKLLSLEIGYASIKYSELENKMRELKSENESLQKELEKKNDEINNIKQEKNEKISDKVEKLNIIMEENKVYAEKKISETKQYYKDKINSINQEFEKILFDKEIEIKSLNEVKFSLEQQKQTLSEIKKETHQNNNPFISEDSLRIFLTKLSAQLNDIIIKYKVDSSFDILKINSQKISVEEALNVMHDLIERLQIEIQLKDKEILNMHKENIKNKDSKPKSNEDNLTLERQEIDVLLKNLDEKDKDINDLKQINADLEIQISKYKNVIDEVKRNYDDLLKNYKSAEKLSYYQNKVNQLTEEKAVILQSNAEAIKNQFNEITELTYQLNEYKKKELEYLKGKNTIPSLLENSNSNKSSSSAEVFFNSTISQEEKNDDSFKSNNRTSLFDDHPKDMIQKVSEEKKYNNNDQLNGRIVESPKSPPKPTANIATKREQGFFTRLIAPIFLTENEINNLNKD